MYRINNIKFNFMEKIEIHILMGLPGSGKTTWRKRNEFKTSSRSYYYSSLDCDEYLIENPDAYNFGRYNTIIDVIKEKFNVDPDKFMCIDGLITTNKQVKEIISLINKNVRKKYIDIINDFRIVIHHWRENRDNCLYNDKYRRDKSCKASIMNLPLDDPNGYDFESEIEVSIEYHDVIKKTIYEGEFEPISRDDNTIRSNTWCSGGDWADCWGNHGSCVVENPVTFTELDNLLERICPNITYLQYKKIEKECIEIETKYEMDYYGGCQQDSYYKCDLKKLYETLMEMGLISEEI